LKVFYCQKLRATTWDQDICKKRREIAYEDVAQKGEAPYSFWPCIGCEDGLKVLKVRSLTAKSILPANEGDIRPKHKRRRKRTRRPEVSGD